MELIPPARPGISIREELNRTPTYPSGVDRSHASSKIKPWTQPYKILEWTQQDNTERALLDEFGHEDEEDDLRLDRPFLSEIVYGTGLDGVMRSKSDVISQINLLLLYPLRRAFAHEPELRFESNHRHFDYTWGIRFEGTADDEPAVIGIVRAPGTIKRDQWAKNRHERINPFTRNLASELRALAHMYRCPQVFCYDGQQLLMLRFQATSEEDLRNCHVQTWVLDAIQGPIVGGSTPDTTTNPASARYALYLLFREGTRRLLSMRAETLNRRARRTVEWNEWQLSTVYYNGEVRWNHPSYGQWILPFGWRKGWNADEKCWRWTAGGVTVWESESVDVEVTES